eukprot:775896-Rhodomonas_salina.2
MGGVRCEVGGIGQAAHADKEHECDVQPRFARDEVEENRPDNANNDQLVHQIFEELCIGALSLQIICQNLHAGKARSSLWATPTAYPRPPLTVLVFSLCGKRAAQESRLNIWKWRDNVPDRTDDSATTLPLLKSSTGEI